MDLGEIIAIIFIVIILIFLWFCLRIGDDKK